jgi:hypothetical protein
MHKRTSVLILSGVLATGVAGAVAITPASATTSANPVTSRLANIKGALSGLVGDGTLTQAQADKVASTLDKKLPKRAVRGPGARFGGMGMSQTRDAAAKALGMTPEKLQTELRSGKSLAQVAKDQKVGVDTLVKAMVAAAKVELATAVKDGTLTQARADKMETALTQRITEGVNRVRTDRRMGHAPRGVGGSASNGGASGGMGSPMGAPMSAPSTVS